MAFAGHQFRIAPFRKDLEEVQRQQGFTPPELIGPPPPAELGYIWSWFIQLKRGPQPLDWQEIKAWSDMTGIQLSPYELDLILRLDSAYQEQLLERSNGG